MKKLFIIYLLSAIVCPFSFSDDEDMRSLVDGNREFAFKLYKELSKQEVNLFFSPYSISTALAMTYAGARGETEKQIAEALCFNLVQGELHSRFAIMQRHLNEISGEKNFTINVANSLWADKTHTFLQDYLNLTKENYSAQVNNVDFISDKDKARLEINSWVEKRTSGKIKELVAKGCIGSNTALLLVNAIYFKGFWAGRFKLENTKDEEFLLSSEKSVIVPMMSQTGEFSCMEDGKVVIVELPYEDEQLSMFIVMPEDLKQFLVVENNFLSGKYEAANLRKRKIFLSLPKFKVECTYNLNAPLVGIGMKDAFDSGKADFSGMDGKKELSLSHVLHKAYVDVNEEGTEAAAATIVAVYKDGVSPRYIRIDHPFIFYIRDNSTKNILFIGRILNPDSSKPLQKPGGHPVWKK